MTTTDHYKLPITVTFDSNVWECIVDPVKRESARVNEQLFQLISSGSIIPFFFEGIATIEAVPKKERASYFPNSRPTISIKIGDQEPRVSEGTPAPQLSPYLIENIHSALKLGFRFIRTPRIGAARLPEEYMAADKYVDLEQRLEGSFKFARHVETLGLGRAEMDAKTRILRKQPSLKKTAEAQDISTKAYAKDVAEWADGDALAAHYGYGLDYFCTNDQGGSAGPRSVFSDKNLAELKKKFSVEVLNPNQLLLVLLKAVTRTK